MYELARFLLTAQQRLLHSTLAAFMYCLRFLREGFIMKKGTICKLLATSALACMASASQAQVVEWWTYSIDMTWTAASFDPAERGYENASYASGLHPTMLSWGDKNGIDDFSVPYSGHSQARSSLNIARDAVFRKGWTGYYGPDGIYGGQTAINMFRHTNNAIAPTTADLTYAQLTMTVDLGVWDLATQTRSPVFLPDALKEVKFDIYFYETPNPGFPVDDILLFANPVGYFSFEHDGEWYSFSYAVQNLIEVDAATCSSVSKGALTGSCFGFSVPEASVATPQLSFQITAVPEPETYAMLLAGLGMVGAIVRRRRNATYNN